MGKQLHELMGWSGPLTHRQYLGWHQWLKLEMDNPSRSDFYLMRLSGDILYGNRKPSGWKPYDQRIDFVRKAERVQKQQEELTPEQAASRSRGAWCGHVGGGIVHTISKKEAARIDKLPPGEAARERRRMAMAKKEAPK